MYIYTILTPTEFKIENKAKNFTVNYMGDEILAIAETDKFNARELAENKQAKIKELIAFVEQQKIVMEANYSSISTGSFIDKRNNALAWEQDPTSPTGYVDKLCKDAAGVVDTVKREALLLAILAKVNDVAKLETYEDDTRTAIKACTTQAELDAIVI